MLNLKPFKPMSPILADHLPEGPDWIFQLKWDGYRLIAVIENGQVQLLSKNMRSMNLKYPEIVEACARLPGTLVLDGEAVVMDPAHGRPSFQKMQQRSKPVSAASLRDLLPVQYIVFDVLYMDGVNLRQHPFSERDRRLRELAGSWQAPLFTTDCFDSGSLLWEWVVQHSWEGVVCKRRTSLYHEGKEHRDWYKKKVARQFDVEIVGIVWREGRVASLVMKENGVYFGRVSSGLNGKLKEKLRLLGTVDIDQAPILQLPALPKGDAVRWLKEPIDARVTGTEVTDEGVLRHPKLVSLKI